MKDGTRGGTARIDLLRVTTQHADGSPADASDWVAVEEPLQIRIAEHPIATTMRTPGNDRELALGFLLSEGLIRSADDIGSLAVCGKPNDPDYGNVLEVTPAPGHTIETDPLERSNRRSYSNSSCGVCGRQSIEDLRALCEPLADVATCRVARIRELLADFSSRQHNFAQTGGVHGAGIAKARGQGWLGVFEDIGRHNAVDKAIGHALLTGASPDLLLVSSRAGFEIVHKACVARIPIVVCISAASSLAIQTADEFGVTLVGFARDHALNVYTHSQRLLS